MKNELTPAPPPTGTIPDALGALAVAQSIDISDNSLEGQIPSALCTVGRFSSIAFVQLSVAGNQLTGSIPSECASNNKLSVLDLSRNLLNGTIPSTLGSTGVIQTVNLADNRLTGGISTALLNLQKLVLSSNLLSGGLPSPLCSNKTSEIFLDGNMFTGAST